MGQVWSAAMMPVADESDMIGMVIVSGIGVAVGEFHREAVGEVVLRAHFPQLLELLDAGYRRQNLRIFEEGSFLRRAGGMLKAKDNGMADHRLFPQVVRLNAV